VVCAALSKRCSKRFKDAGRFALFLPLLFKPEI